MRIFSLILTLLFLFLGIVFGALNSADVVLDFYRWQVELPLGVSLLGAALLGALAAGLLLWTSVIWPQRRKLTALRRQVVSMESASTPTAAPQIETRAGSPSAFPGAP